MPKPDPIAVVRTDFANTGPNRNGEPIVAAINGLNTYSQDSIIFRQSSATSLPDNTDVSGFNLHPGSVVRLANDGVTLLTPDFIPPFTDGGYYAEDTISYNSIAEAGQVFRNIPTENLSLTSTGNQRFIGVSNNTSSTSFPFTYPSAPFGLTYRMRAIVRAGDASIEFEHRDEFDRYSGKSVVSVETFGTRKDLLCYLPDEDPELDADARANYRLEDIGSRVVDTSVLVLSATLTVNPIIGGRATGNIKCVAGFHTNVAAAYADERAGRAFACLHPIHPNYLGEVSYTGAFRDGYEPTTGETFPTINTGRLYYAEMLAGSRFNNIDNPIILGQADPDEPDNENRDLENLDA